MTKTLNEEQVAVLRMMRQEVDNLQDALRDGRGDKEIAHRLYYARDRLKEYTSDLRADGFMV